MLNKSKMTFKTIFDTYRSIKNKLNKLTVQFVFNFVIRQFSLI